MSVKLLPVNRTALDQRATAASVPQLFSEQVARSPEAIALTSEGSPWTYRELEEAANRLAHLVAAHRAGAGDVVAVMIEPSAEAVIAMLAVLKTGATYLPIDPALPDAEAEFLLDDAAPIAAITATADVARLANRGLPIINIDDPVINTSYPTYPLPHPNPDNIACIVYPSASAGSPEGLAVTHHNIASQSPSEDGSIWEIWTSLLRAA